MLLITGYNNDDDVTFCLTFCFPFVIHKLNVCFFLLFVCRWSDGRSNGALPLCAYLLLSLLRSAYHNDGSGCALCWKNLVAAIVPNIFHEQAEPRENGTKRVN